ncbi:hypothetical protein SLA2020_141480 [Shorea laevis]
MKLFTKSLTQTDVQKRLSAPVMILSSLPDFKGNAVNLRVRDARSRQVWTFKCSIRKKNHPKPVFCSDWLDFVRCNDLHVGDEVKFYKEMDEATGANYKIEVKKAVRVFGVIFGYVET